MGTFTNVLNAKKECICKWKKLLHFLDIRLLEYHKQVKHVTKGIITMEQIKNQQKILIYADQTM